MLYSNPHCILAEYVSLFSLQQHATGCCGNIIMLIQPLAYKAVLVYNIFYKKCCVRDIDGSCSVGRLSCSLVIPVK